MLSANTLTDPAAIFDSGALLQTSGVIPASGAGLAMGANDPVIPAGANVIGTSAPPPQQPAQSQSLAGGALLAEAPFPLAQTFQLHSFAGAAKIIYLDFVGFTTRNTQWNSDYNLANIVTPAFSLDSDFGTFSDAERTLIQSVWERVSEDFRPFNVDVTTQDPGVEALRNTSPGDVQYGIRVVIGGSTLDWFTPASGATVGGVAYVGSFTSNLDEPAFVFGADFGNMGNDIAEAASHETGHTLGLSHDAQDRFYLDSMTGKFVRVHLTYYPGHPDPPSGAPTDWAPIMGVGYGKNITQWSKGEYPNATNIEDDLSIITTQNGFTYRTDDHGNSRASADTLAVEPSTADADVTMFSDEGIIEQNTDIDYFSFTVKGLGEIVDLNINGFHNGPDLDILAKLYNANGTVIATSNSLDDLNASFASQTLAPGTYYISVQGDGRNYIYLDPAAHPGPIMDDPTVPDASDWGYTNYGSLGYYSITGTSKKQLVVGVDFDTASGTSPENWNLYSGGGTPTDLTGLISEAGFVVPYQLTIGSSGNAINTVSSANPIETLDLPNHGIPLDKLDGYISSPSDTLSFVWSNLTPSTVYQIFVFGSSDHDAENQVTVTGGEWNGIQQTYSFKQFISPDGLVVNNNAPGSEDLSSYSLLVISNADGQITITVTGADGAPAAVAGLAIAPTSVGSIAGQKWDDADGDLSHDSGENGLPGWVIYLDTNNDGQLNSTSDENITVPARSVPQPLLDYATVKNDLTFADVGQILDIDVTLDITHTYDADVNVTLISPAGTRVKLFGDLGGSSDNFTSTVLDDQATLSIASGLAPFTGRFKPQNPLSAFNGENPAGTWTLEVTDDASGDTGVLNSWSISVKLAGAYLEPYTTTDANGDYSFTNLPAGQYFVREHFTDERIQQGWHQTFAPTPVTVRSGANVTGVDFGNWIPVAQEGSIQGQVFNDVTSDGVKGANDPGLGGWVVYIDSNNNGVRDVESVPTILAATGLPKAITDFSTVNSQITFPSLGTVFSVQVTLDITHSFVGDLDAYLISPSGRQVELFTGVGGQYNDFTNLTLDDSAVRSIATLGQSDLPYTGTWQPEGHLSDFLGEDAAGTWTLQIRDTAFADEGALNSWSLKITSGEVFRTTDGDGQYSFGPLPAGQYVVREEPASGWLQIPPIATSIPAAVWANSQWTVAIAAVDDPNDPNGPDSHRNVKNVDFGNNALQPLAGDFDRSGGVDMADYILWRKSLGTSVGTIFSGADGNGNGVIDAGDLTVWRANFGHHLDDYGNSALVANRISTLPSTRHGVIETAGDVDWFKFDATAGQTYDLSTTLGTLSDSVLRLIDTDGVTQIDLNDNAIGLASFIRFTATTTGTYYVEVSGANTQAGAYDLTVAPTSDDHGNFAAAATLIAVPSTTAGNIETIGDQDWFKFNATSGATYHFDVVLGFLADSQLQLLGTDGTTELAFDDDGGPGFASHLDWVAPSSGTFYLNVKGFGSDLGSYNLTATFTGPGAGAFLALVSGSSLSSVDVSPTASEQSSAASLTAQSSSVSPGVAFEALDFALPSGSPLEKGLLLSSGTVASEAQSEAALLAWVESLAAGSDGVALSPVGSVAGNIHGENGGDDLSSVDSIFDRIGAAAVAEGCAV